MNTRKSFICAGLALALTHAPAHAAITGVSGPVSSMGTAPAIIAAPEHALENIVTNTGMQGFDEAQGVTTTVDYAIDGGTLPAGTTVNSHMIFQNPEGGAVLNHFDVTWTFDGVILGVMSDKDGTFEAASTFELGSPSTNYTVTFPGSGPAAPFAARGIERNTGPSAPSDGYSIDGNSIKVGMNVPGVGDWIRVVTAAAIKVSVDINPGSCPNPLNCKARGVLPVAIAGTATLDVTTIDPVTIRLAGVAPLRSDIEDVTMPTEPFTGKQDCEVDCLETNPDGIDDLTLKFDRQEVIGALGDAVLDGACVVVELTGNLQASAGGTAIVGEDVMRILCKRGNK